VAPAAAVPVAYLDPAAVWVGTLGERPPGGLSPAAVATVHLAYDDTSAGVSHREVFEAVVHPLGPVADSTNVHAVDHDPRDFTPSAPAGASYRLPEVPIDTKTYWTALSRSLEDHLVRERRVTVWKNDTLDLYSRVGESREEFTARCAAAAEDAADAAVAKLRDTYATRIERVKDQLANAERRVADLEGDVSSRRQEEVLSGAGDLLGALLGGRRRSSSLSRAASRRSQTRRTEQRLDTAVAAVEDKAADLVALEDDLETEVLEITQTWDEAAGRIEPVEIPLEKTDVSVTDLSLVWL
jgi:hypothetical protein